MEILSNARLKELVKLQQKKYRVEAGELLVEGFRLIEQLISDNIPISEIFCLEKDVRKMNRICNAPVTVAVEWHLQKLSGTKNSQNIIALLKAPESKIIKTDFLLYLDDISEPGNLGTIFRTASAFGIDGIILSPGCCEVLNPKVIRASLGAVFSVPFEIRDTEWLRNQNAMKVCTAMEKAVPIDDIKVWKSPLILVVGSEAKGISRKILEMADHTVYIPMSGKMESLNAAMATAIAIYHIRLISK